MNLQIVGVFLFFTCIGASSPGSFPMDFMAGVKKENILHLKDPHAEVKDFSEAFKDVAKSEEKVKTTFRILNRPNDSRFKLDLVLILSQLVIMENESQSFENRQKAWSVLQPVLEKYDKNFTYDADYDVLSGEFIEIIVDDWLDRYTQEKVVHKSSRQEGSEGSGSLEEYLTSQEQESEVSTEQEGSGEVSSVTEADLVALLSGEDDSSTEEEESPSSSEESVVHYSTEQEDDSSEGYVTTEEEESASSTESVLHYSAEQEDDSSEGYVTTEEEELASSTENVLHYATEQDSSEGYEIHTTTEDESEGYELHYTTEEESSSAEGYEIAHSAEEVESSTEYQLVGTTEDGEAVLQSTTEYYIPEVVPEVVETEVLDVLAEEGDDSDQVSKEVEESVDDFERRSGYVVVGKEPLRAGSIRGIPGVHFPDYDEIPITSFTCADKKYIPGFYADLETGCQVFHVCWPHRRESFLCPIGTLFNQAILSCDYWYSTNCSLSALYYDVNNRIYETTTTPRPTTYKPTPKPLFPHPKQPVTKKPLTKPTTPHPKQPSTPTPSLADVDWAKVLSILPIKSKVTVYPHSSKTSAADKDFIFGKTEQGKALKKAIATQIIGKVLHAAEALAKTAVHTLPPKFATKKPGQVIHTTEKPKIRTTVKPAGKIQPPPKIIDRFVVKPRKFDVLKPIMAGKLATAPKVGKQQMVQKVKMVKEHIPDVLLGAMEMAGTVLQKDILPLTRMALVESSLKHSKSKKH